MAIGISAPFVARTVAHLRREGTVYHDEPSTGLHAIYTMALLCESVDLYGFEGDGTIDHHFIGHTIRMEHRLMRLLANHSLPDADFPDLEAADRWRHVVVRYGTESAVPCAPVSPPLRGMLRGGPLLGRGDLSPALRTYIACAGRVFLGC